jgi:predicted nucleic acid-binding protein
MQIAFRTVPDTNIVISAQFGNPQSPNKEYFRRWHNNEFYLLYSNDTLSEYILKMTEFGIPEEDIQEYLESLLDLGVPIEIEHYHLHVYPDDRDDIAFVLCADNGKATHLISYDKHLLDLQYRHEFSFKICKIVEFLKELRNR